MLKIINEAARTIPVTHEADVVVAGGGTAGVACAVCAARLGLKVIMIENSAHPGGMVTQITQWSGDFENKGGFTKEYYQHLLSQNIMKPPYYNPYLVMPYFDSLLKDAGVKCLYFSRVVAPILDNKKLTGVIIESKQGRHAVSAKIVIDATGDGDVAAGAGANFELGRETDGATQSISLSHLMQNFPFQRVHLCNEIMPSIAEINPNYQLPYDHGNLQHLTKTKESLIAGFAHVICNNPLNVDDLSEAAIELRQQASEFFELIKQTKWGAELEFGPFSALLGIRESRRIIGDEKATLDNYSHPHGLFTVDHHVDIHKCRLGEPAIIVTKVKPYLIPYGALLPKGLEQIMVIGRCISGSHEGLASYRLISDCFAMGEAAALAAEQAMRLQKGLRDISIDAIITKMRKLGYQN